MNRILVSIINIIKQSMSFDKDLRDDKICNLQKRNDLIKSNLNTLIVLNFNVSHPQIYDLLKNIYYLNNKIIDSFEPVNTFNNRTNADENILLFFYKQNCKPSNEFVNEWKLLQQHISGVKFISIDCDSDKQAEICNRFGVYEYPTVKYVSNGKINDYHGEMTYSAIRKEFFE